MSRILPGISPRPILLAIALGAFAATGLVGCGPQAHSQVVRQKARDRYDLASAQIIYDQARQAFQSGQFEPALGHIDRAIARFPKDASFQLLRGRILHEMSRVDQARDAFAKAVELDPRKAEPHYYLGIIYQRWRDYPNAVKEYSMAAALDSSRLHYVAAEIEVLTIQGKYDDAERRLADVQQRFEFSPVIDRLRADIAKMKGDHDVCSTMLERAAVRESSSTPDVLEELAYARYSKGDWQGSLTALEDPVLAKVRNRPDLARLRARNLLALNRPGDARNILLTIKNDSDPEGRTLLLLGQASWRLGDWGRLRDCGETLTRLHPRYADGYLFVGAAANAQGKLAESIAAFEQAVALDPQRDASRRLLSEATSRAQRSTVNVRSVGGTASAGVFRDAAP